MRISEIATDAVNVPGSFEIYEGIVERVERGATGIFHTKLRKMFLGRSQQVPTPRSTGFVPVRVGWTMRRGYQAATGESMKRGKTDNF